MWALALFGVVLLLQFYFYIFLFRKFSAFQQGLTNESKPFVSVVVCARNEEESLKQNLPYLLGQKYPDFELVLVDDASSDGSYQVMRSVERGGNSSPKINVISIAASESRGKKHALSKGILAARGEVLLLTDADCKPVSKDWIKEMVQAIPDNDGIVLGYGPYKKIKGSFLNKLVRYETLTAAIQYFSYALDGNPYMGVGRNLAYHKSLFKRHNGFKDHEHLLSGDDDLFVSQAASGSRVRICVSPESFTYSEPKRDWKSWIRQKQRHITTSAHYRKRHQYLLGLFYLSQLGFYLLSAILLIYWDYPYLTLSMIGLRFVVFYAVINSGARKLQEKDLITFSPLYEFSIIFMQLYIFIKNLVAPPKQW
jgi:cellulose synthase/poly-beta-1,6-N-acetylglucosamine synthase-like glycosyltransferase